MDRCLSCGKEIEKKERLHKKCIRNLFKVDYFPEIELSLKEVSIKAQQTAGKLSISGVQPKLSIRLNRENKKLETVSMGGEYILKPQVITYPNLPQNENLCMTLASNFGIDVPPHSLLKLKDNSWAYIVKRFDREKGEKIHQEDFFQILGKKDKYQGSLEEIGKKITNISEIPGLDVQLFFERILFFFIIGNGDAHLKNFSVIYDRHGHIRLSPAYDIVSSKLVIPGEEDFALPIQGKKNNINGKDFIKFLNFLKIPEKAGMNILLKFSNQKQLILGIIKDSILEDGEKQKLLKIVTERYSRLKSGTP